MSSSLVEENATRLANILADTDSLVRAAVRFATAPRRNTPRWVAVKTIFCVGSTVGTALCRKYGCDPDEYVKVRR